MTMRKHVMLICLLFISASAIAQFGRQRGLDPRNRIPNQPPNDAQKEAMKKKAENRKEEFIAKFLTTLEADEFQLEIIKQSLEEYFDKQPELYKKKYRTKTEFQDTIDSFNEAHFSELRTLISESDMEKINLMIEGKYEEDDKKKKKKRKNRKKDKD